MVSYVILFLVIWVLLLAIAWVAWVQVIELLRLTGVLYKPTHRRRRIL